MKKLSLILSFILCYGLAQAHSYESKSDSLLDDFLNEMLTEKETDINKLIDMPTHFHFLYFSSMYSPKTMYAGREIGDNISNYSGMLYYFISNGLYMGVSGSYYQEFDPHYQSTIATIGLSKGKNSFRYRTSYGRYFYHIPDFKPSYSNVFSAGFSFIKKPFGLRGDYSLLFGEETDSKISTSAYWDFTLWKNSKHNSISLEPQVYCYFGTETIETEIIIDEDLELYFTDEEKAFGLMNTALSLPLSISMGNFIFEAEYIYNITRSLDPAFDYDNSHNFTFSLGYIISLN